jgi:hypothetical protein
MATGVRFLFFRNHRRTLGWSWLLATGLALVACAIPPPLSPIQRTAELPARARVELSGSQDGILKFLVTNLTDESLIVSRDAIVMSSSQGVRNREPGGVANMYLIPPKGIHDVNVRFSFEGVKVGETVNVLFDRALLVDGHPLPMPAISLRVEALAPAAQGPI